MEYVICKAIELDRKCFTLLRSHWKKLAFSSVSHQNSPFWSRGSELVQTRRYQWLTYGGGHKKWSKEISKIWFFFSKVLKLFRHGMGCFGTGLGMLFHLYKGLLVTHEFLEKNEKNSSKIAVFCLWGPLYWGWPRKQQFSSCFFRFSRRVRVWRANLYRGETTSPSRSRNNSYHVWKVWELLKKSNFSFFLTIFYGLLP